LRPLPQPPLLLITDRLQAQPRPLEWVVAAALEGGVRWISLREKDLDEADRLAMLQRLKRPADRAGALLMVHDDVPAAAALGLAGVHLPRNGSAAVARAALPDALIGQSWHGTAAAAPVQGTTPDYLTLSPIFMTSSKPGYGPALGPAGFAAARRLTATPLIALGGIEPMYVAACMAAGAAGVAVMGSVMRATDPARACAELLDRLAISLSSGVPQRPS
jgi:thiamine-phosphate pyrophosphorylase